MIVYDDFRRLEIMKGLDDKPVYFSKVSFYDDFTQVKKTDQSIFLLKNHTFVDDFSDIREKSNAYAEGKGQKGRLRFNP